MKTFHPRTLLRAAAVVIASTALVSGGALTSGATAAPGDTVSLGIQNTTLNGFKGTTSTVVPVTFTASRANLTFVKANVSVNGAVVATGVSVTRSGFLYQQAWGAGTVQLSGLTESNGSAVAGGSNPFAVRYGIEGGYNNISVKKKGKKLTFKIKVRYIDNRGVAVGIRKATVQVKKGSKWKTLKNVKLKANGTRTFKKSDKKKRNYRLVIKTTAVYSGGQTDKIRI